MKHEVFDKCSIEIVDSDLTFKLAYADECVPTENYNDIIKADVLLYPNKFSREDIPICFPEQTMYFFNYLKEEARKENVIVDICASDENYLELELHTDLVTIASIVTTSVALPIVTKIIASYLYDLWKNRKTELNTKIKITVDSNRKAKCIKYEGDAKYFEASMASIDKHIFNGD